MSELSHAARVLRIREMLDTHPYVTVKRLRDEFSVSRRTVYNDLQALEDAGVPVFSEKGPDGEARWQLVWPAKKQPIPISKRQLVPLDLARLALSFLSGTAVYGQVEESLRRFGRGLGPEAKAALAKVPRKLAVIPHGPKDYRNKDAIVDLLLTALLDEHALELDYRSPGKQKKTFMLAPLTLLIYREALYLVAAFLDDEGLANRATLAVDRIIDVRPQPRRRFAYPEDYDPREMFRGAFGLICGGDEEDVELVFDAQQAPFVRERDWHPTQSFGRTSDGRMRMTMRVRGLEDVYRWLVGHADSVDVLKPAALKKRVKEALQSKGRSR